jgi:hypothetical protein
MDAMDRFGQELVLAGRRQAGRQPLYGTRFARTSSRRRVSAHVRIALIALVLVLATAAITLAATGVILEGSPVGTRAGRRTAALPASAGPGRWPAVGNADHPHHARAHLRADRPRR